MNILAIETASTVCGAALFLNNQQVALDEINQPRIHGKKLPLIVQDLLNVHSLSINQLDGIAVSSGPGSYTGLRIGMNLARGLAASCDIPIIPIPTLLAMNRTINYEGIYWVLLHSHKNMVYAQRYHAGRPVAEIEFGEYQSKKYFSVYGFNLENFCNDYISISPSAKSIGELGLQNYDKWAQKDLNQVTPNYINSFNIEKKQAS